MPAPKRLPKTGGHVLLLSLAEPGPGALPYLDAAAPLRQEMDGICHMDNFRVYDFPPPTMKQACDKACHPPTIPTAPQILSRCGCPPLSPSLTSSI